MPILDNSLYYLFVMLYFVVAISQPFAILPLMQTQQTVKAGERTQEITELFEGMFSGDRDFFCGGDSCGDIAQEWADEGFSSDQVEAWCEARCFRASNAAELRDAGITPEQASETTKAGIGNYSDTIGYKLANRDINIETAKKLTTLISLS